MEIVFMGMCAAAVYSTSSLRATEQLCLFKSDSLYCLEPLSIHVGLWCLPFGRMAVEIPPLLQRISTIKNRENLRKLSTNVI